MLSVERRIAFGGLALFLAAAQFLVAMLVTQAAYPGYSAVANFVSDLGATGSPAAWLFNLSLWVMGALGVLGTYLVLPGLPKGRVALAGASVLTVTWVFAFLVGVFPEQTGSIHTNVSGVAFLGAGIALGLLGSTFGRALAWRPYRLYTLLSAAVTFASLVVFIAWQGGPIQGVLERLVILPILLWSAVVGLRLALPATSWLRPFPARSA